MEELTKKLLQDQDKYENLRKDLEEVFKKYGMRPIEIYRVANELQARSFEMLINAMDTYIEQRVKEAQNDKV